jgi:hypothetical protein
MRVLVQQVEGLRSAAASNRGGVISITVETLDEILAALEDAERYRWLREQPNRGDLRHTTRDWMYETDELDAAIDAARK